MKKKRINPKFDRNNFPWKVREAKAGHLIPVVKICESCGFRKVKHHHFLCDVCYENKKKNITKRKELEEKKKEQLRLQEIKHE